MASIAELQRRKRASNSTAKDIEQTLEGLPEIPLRAKIADKLRAAKALAKRSADKSAKAIQGKREQAAAGEYVTRAEWGAAAPKSSMSSQPTVNLRVLHHTAYPALSPTASKSDEAARMRVIQQGHFSRGFSDIGYHAVVFPSGRIYQGRDGSKVGAGVYGHNTGTTHVSADGNYEVTHPTEALVKGLKAAFDRLPGANATLKGHRDLEPNACPGRNLYPRLDDIR